MSTNTPTPKSANAGILAMRAALAAKALAKAEGREWAPKTQARPARAQRSASREVGADVEAHESADLPEYTWAVLVAHEPQAGVIAHTACVVRAATPRRAAKAARRDALARGVSELRAVTALVREDSPAFAAVSAMPA